MKKMRKVTNVIKKLVNYGFKVYDFGWNWDNSAIFYYVIDKKDISKTFERASNENVVSKYSLEFKKKVLISAFTFFFSSSFNGLCL